MFKKVFAAVISASLILSTFSINTFAYTSSNWMSSLADNRSLTSISIPGTHDSGARYEPVAGTAKCQNLTIAEQLSAGVRFLDVRCRHIDNSFAIHHGNVYQNINFTDVVNACYSFLNSNPSETILMSVKEEYDASNNTRTFEQTFDSYVAGNPSKWYLSDAVPKLGSVRGKIVLVRRFGASSTPKGINCTTWGDNTTSTTSSGGTSIKIQDQYVVPDNAAKWTTAQNLLNEAKNQNSSWLYLNFMSGYKSLLFGIPSITTVSDYMNPQINTYFTNNTSGRFGVVIMDFATAALASKVYSTNTDQTASQDMIAQINALGTLTHDSYSTGLNAKIAAVESSYAQLTSSAKALVTNYSTLTSLRSQYNAYANRSAFSTIQGVTYDGKGGNSTDGANANAATLGTEGTNPSFNVKGTKIGYWFYYNNVNFGSGASKVTFNYSVNDSNCASGSVVELRLGSSTGTLVGSFPVQYTGGWANRVTQTVDLSTSVSGNQNLYMVLKLSTGGTEKTWVLNLFYFNFS
ncbi:MAG: Phosphatidylinositol diacylglycerol-lyase [Oscillospiraceae bacterium]|nr:Phosphatidylinositol diacylglycerol-lyase [Oscillospiraceae bacterium]